jgi:hypothetical protein
VLDALADFGDDHVRDRHAERFDIFDLDASQGQQIDEFGNTRRKFDELTEPIEGDFHGRRGGRQRRPC